MSKLRTSKQNRIIHSLVNRWNFTGDDKAEMVFGITEGRTCSTKEMTFDEANVMIKRLDGRPVVEQPLKDKSRRTVQYHRQKQGVEQIITPTMKDFIHSLQRGRNMSDDGLKSLCRRMLKKDFPQTNKEANKIVEAIKAMNRRDRTFNLVKKDDQEAA